VRALDVRVVPFAAALVVPLLGRMADPDDPVRRMASLAFAEVVRLLPLDPTAAVAPAGADGSEDRRLLAQLVDPTRAPPYVLPVTINATLRPYQQEGVNWLAFLARYRLHGILCDGTHGTPTDARTAWR
jgi:TATA-binding protein-associated factor